MPQPLSRVHPKAQVRITPDALTQNPELALMAMQVIGIWAHTDGDLATLLSAMLRSDIAAGTAMYLTLTTRRARKEALEAAAKAVLPTSDFDLLLRALKTMKASQDRRDQFAHQVWGFSPEVTNALCLVQPGDVTNLSARWRQGVESGKKPIEIVGEAVRYALPYSVPSELDHSKIQVFRKVDFTRELKNATSASFIVRDLYYIASGHPLNEAARTRLSAPSSAIAVSTSVWEK